MNILHPQQRGQSLVEIAISLPILLLIVSGLFDIGRVYFVQIAMEDAAREGASYIAMNPTCTADSDADAMGACDAPNNAYFRICKVLSTQLLLQDEITQCVTPESDSRIEVDMALVDGAVQGGSIAVTIQYEYQFFTPAISTIWDSVLLEVNVNDVILQGM